MLTGHPLRYYYEPTYLDRVLFQKLTVAVQMLEKFPALCGTPKSMYKIPSLVSVLNQINLVFNVRHSFDAVSARHISTLLSQTGKILVMQNSTVSVNIIFLRNKYSRQHLVLKSLN
jgi:hypothetical protein